MKDEIKKPPVMGGFSAVVGVDGIECRRFGLHPGKLRFAVTTDAPDSKVGMR